MGAFRALYNAIVIQTFFCLLLLALGNPRTLEPRRAAWSEVDPGVFSSAWMLPENLWKPADESRALPLALPELLAARFDAPADQPWMASVGDMIAEHRRRGGTRAALGPLLKELLTARPATHARVGKLLRKLLVADALLDPKWDPSDEKAEDGVWFGESLERNPANGPPWNANEGASTLHQAATFVRADLDSFVRALHDYAAALSDPGTSYETLEPEAGSILAGEDDAHGPFAALKIAIRADLPFPYSHYDLDLRVLHKLDGAKHLVTYVFSTSHDFYWLAGEDWHFPVKTSAGEWLGTLVVRLSGFDLRGVPDGEDNRKTATRGALGNLRRRAEADFARSGGVPRNVDGAVPQLHVLAAPAQKR